MDKGDVSMSEVHQLLSMHPGLSDVLRMEDAMRFIRLATSLKKHIIHAQKSTYNEAYPPSVLPPEIHQFLGSAMNLCADFLDGCWMAFRHTVWTYDCSEHTPASDAHLFHEHRSMYRLSKSKYLFLHVVLLIIDFGHSNVGAIPSHYTMQ